ncbi:pyruvate kinase [Promethearchaeum syntrophicum]|uniref:Pyruvate kinase n=1 Tax=Promethearchaeum syntrophicum TaxID=2594042 RepID=A0A5B9DBQ0_9ARCH|nr:pyruvate kinase [Candidatus Prometheoarchaeum syntrophicum]QEE16277.1 Pyruvate kinase [Candidatus Prometheoarchaeum syntrophicum]
MKSFEILEKLVKSKIVTTLGPASSSEEMLLKLRDQGVDVFRINMSHASKGGKEVKQLFNRIRKVTPELAILMDIQGPKIRIGEIEGVVILKHGDTFRLFEKTIVGNKEQASISYKGFLTDIQIGNFIFINDGLVRLKVISKNMDEGYLQTEVIAGGPISSRKGVNIPSGALSTKNPTDKDIHDLKLIASLIPEYLAASFIANASEVKTIRAMLDNAGAPSVKIISKIERPIALDNFDEILAVSDGIMVARGDLGVEIPAEEVPIRQKEMIMKCNRASKPVIVATQMLESMINNPVPTRAEVNDVFNAVYDRSDAVMLSGETSVGKFPLEAVKYMDKIICKAEKYIPIINPNVVDSEDPEMYEAVGHAVYLLAENFKDMNYRGKIVMFTGGGKSTRKAAKYRPAFPILAITNKKTTARQLNLIWGVHPYLIKDLKFDEWSSEEIMQNGIKALVEYGILELREHVICTIPSRISPVRCSIMGLYYVEDILRDIEIETKEYIPDFK